MWEATWLAKRDIPLTKILLMRQISFIFILCLFNKGDDMLTEISSFKAKWDEQKFVKMCQPARRDENYTNAYVTIEINTWLLTCVQFGKMRQTLYKHKNILSCLLSQLKMKYNVLPSCSVWATWPLWKWRYNIFYLPHDYVIEMLHEFVGVVPFILSHHPAKFESHGLHENGDVTFFICHVTISPR